ncbi:hypothetical protein J0910_13655 [Nocardiopsis sp. CNT-189]|uniref:hypothetical protein n=1 Tax=Nocardiopsis oceanisediminis TaxID=2816862 RepID=UPI003B30C8FE
MGGSGMAGGHLEWDPEQQRWIPSGRPAQPGGALAPQGVWPSGPEGKAAVVALAALVLILVVGVPVAVFAAWSGEEDGVETVAGEDPGAGADAGGEEGPEAPGPLPDEERPWDDLPGEGGGTEPDEPAADGYTRVEEPEGFALSVPDGWERDPTGEEGAGAVYVAGDPRYRLQVLWQEDPAVGAREEAEAILADASGRSDYEELSFSGGGDAVEFEYSYDNTVHGPRYVMGSAFGADPVHVIISAGPEYDRGAVAEVHAAAAADFCADALLCG